MSSFPNAIYRGFGTCISNYTTWLSVEYISICPFWDRSYYDIPLHLPTARNTESRAEWVIRRYYITYVHNSPKNVCIIFLYFLAFTMVIVSVNYCSFWIPVRLLIEGFFLNLIVIWYHLQDLAAAVVWERLFPPLSDNWHLLLLTMCGTKFLMTYGPLCHQDINYHYIYISFCWILIFHVNIITLYYIWISSAVTENLYFLFIKKWIPHGLLGMWGLLYD